MSTPATPSRPVDEGNAEAGPSTPRSYRTAPDTPTKTGSARRRSWFGLGGFAGLTTPTREPNDTPRRLSLGAALDLGAGGMPQTPRAALDDDTKEELTIDAQPASSPRRSKRRSGNVDGDEGEVLVLQELTKRSSSIDRERRMKEEIRTSVETLNPSEASPDHTILLRGPLSPERTDDVAGPTVSPRTSSLSANLVTSRSSIEKTTPPLPIDRPLPALPPDPGTPPHTASTSTSTLMPPPSDIIITPSSPRKLQKAPSRRPSTIFDDMLGRSRTSEPMGQPGSRSSSHSRKTISRKASLVGLGRPGVHRQGSDDAPPPVPAKPISVSSPHPSRPTSPAPRITFLETEPDNRQVTSEGSQEERRLKTKRSRSLSGIFGRSSEHLVVPGAPAANTEEVIEETIKTQQPAQEAAPTTISHSAEMGRMSNVLSWFGVKKSSKRRNTVSTKDQEADQGASKKEANAANEPQPTTPALPSQYASSAEAAAPRANRGRGLTVSTNSSPSETPRPIIAPSSAPIAVPLRASHSFGSSTGSAIMGPPSIMSGRSSWVASPAVEEEEIIFSPPSAPWVDSPTASTPVSGTVSPMGVMSEIIEGVPSGPTHVDARSSGLPKSGSASSGNIASLRAQPESRHRAWSDAPHPSPSLAPPNPPTSLESPSRPKMGSRSNSGNSAIIDRMKGVFAKSTSARNRSRSRSLLPGDEEHVDEFGGIAFKSRHGRPSTAGSGYSVKSHRAPNATLLDLHGADKRIFLDDSPGRSARNSFSGSAQTKSTVQSAVTAPVHPTVASTGRGSMDAAVPASAVPQATKTRARASTVSFSATSPPSAFAPPSPMFKALGATPPRRRPSAISRISGGRLGSTPSSPKGGSLFPLPPRSSGGSSVPALSADEGHSASGQSILLSPGTSPRPSTTSLTGRNEGLLKQVSKVEEGQSVKDWLDKVQHFVGSSDIAGVLASSGDAFHAEALKLYMAQFDFTHQALDVALRKLLLRMSLPKETQQIDRVIEAFSQRYEDCEPGLFGSSDNTYVLAFSMMMLHTDAFNKHNKHKMTKADYVRNTRLDGVSNTVLEAFYDNVTFTPFVYQDDEDALLTPGTAPAMSRGTGTDGRSRSGSDTGSIGYPFPTTPASGFSTGYGPTSAGSIGTSGFSLSQTPRTASIQLGGQRTDVYSLIANDGLAALRVDLEQYIPPASPFSCLGTKITLEAEQLHERFLSAGILRIDASPTKKKVRRKGGEEETVIRVTKAGLLHRRDDSSEHGRKSTKKGKAWSVILTGTQLLFFKDPFWAAQLLEHIKTTKRNDRGHLVLPAMGNFVPDEVFPVKDAVAVHDSELDLPNSFRFHLSHRQYVITTSNEGEMNDWVSLINYAAAFKTAGIRMRGGHLEREQAVLAGAAAASSFKREVVQGAPGTATPPRKAVFGNANSPAVERSAEPAGEEAAVRDSVMGDDGLPQLDSVSTAGSIAALASIVPTSTSVSMPPPKMEATVLTKTGRINPEIDPGEPIAKDDGERLEEVFDVVKAELTAGNGHAARQVIVAAAIKDKDGHKRQGSGGSARRRHAGRTAEVQNHIKHLRSRLTEAEAQLSAHIDQARNLAILTPFQRTTRDRIASTIPALASRIRADRLQVARYSIYLTVLARDHERDERDFARIRHVAIQAAAKSLSNPKGVKGVLEDERTLDRPVPILSLPSQGTTNGKAIGRTSQEDVGANAASRARSPSLQGGASGDEHDQPGYASDTHSIFGPSEARELPVMFRRESDGMSPLRVGTSGAGAEAGSGPAHITQPYRRPAFGRTASANSVASSTGSFFGPRGGQPMSRQGSNLLAPPVTS